MIDDNRGRGTIVDLAVSKHVRRVTASDARSPGSSSKRYRGTVTANAAAVRFSVGVRVHGPSAAAKGPALSQELAQRAVRHVGGRWLETGREIVLKFKTSKPFLLVPSSAGGSLRLAVAAFSSSKQCQNAPTRLATADSGGRKVIRVNKSGGYRVPRIQSRSTSWQRMYKSNGYEVILLCCALRIDRASRVYSHVARDVVDWRSGGDGNWVCHRRQQQSSEGSCGRERVAGLSVADLSITFMTTPAMLKKGIRRDSGDRHAGCDGSGQATNQYCLRTVLASSTIVRLAT